MWLNIFQHNQALLNHRIHLLVNQKINFLINDCNKKSQFIHQRENYQFAQKLISYLKTRKAAPRFFSNNVRVMLGRSQYVLKLINALVKEDIGTIKSLLSETKIKPFQGFFSQNFYDLLVGYRQSRFGFVLASVPAPRWRLC